MMKIQLNILKIMVNIFENLDSEHPKKSSKNKTLQKQKQSYSKINQNIHNDSNF